MNKKKIYEAKIEIMKEFLKDGRNVDSLKKIQEKHKDVLEPAYMKQKEKLSE